MKTYLLYVDESGTSSPTFRPNFPYILTGIVIEESKQDKLKELFDTLKLKYWGNTNVVLHSEDIGKNINECSIFRGNSALKKEFIEDLLDVINKAPVLSFHALVDKSKLPNNWKEATIIKKTAQSVFFNFLTYLLTRPNNSRGKLIIEASSVFKDAEYLKTFTFFLSPGCKLIDEDFPGFEIIKKRLTQISFVTKLNNDSETQMADILGYGAYCKYQQMNGASFSEGSYKGKICSIIDKKVFALPQSASDEKKKLFKKINSFEIIRTNY